MKYCSKRIFKPDTIFSTLILYFYISFPNYDDILFYLFFSTAQYTLVRTIYLQGWYPHLSITYTFLVCGGTIWHWPVPSVPRRMQHSKEYKNNFCSLHININYWIEPISIDNIHKINSFWT